VFSMLPYWREMRAHCVLSGSSSLEKC